MEEINYIFKNNDAKDFVRKISSAIYYKGGISEKIVKFKVKEFIDICFMNGIELNCRIINEEMF